MNKLRAATDEYGFRNVWTVDGKILYKVHDTTDSKPTVYNWSLIYDEKNSFVQRSFALV